MEDFEKFAEAFKALSNANRLRIFLSLAACPAPYGCCDKEETECTCMSRLRGELDIAPSTASHHLKELRRAGLIQTKRNGKNISCWVDSGMIEEMVTFFSQCLDRVPPSI